MFTPRSTRARVIATILAILLFSFAMRLYRINAQPLSGDEAFTVVTWPSVTLTELLTSIAKIDPQPPLALLTFYTWLHLAGTSATAGRLLPTLFSTITVAAAYRFTRAIANRRTATLAALFCAINPFQIWYAQDIRPYSLWIAFSTLSATFYLALLRHQPQPKLKTWLTYSAAALAALFTFYLEAFSLLTQNFSTILHKTRQHRWMRQWVLTQSVILSAIAAWLLASNLQTGTYQPTASSPNVIQAMQVLILGEAPSLQNPYLASLISFIIALSLMSLLATNRHRQPAIILSLFIILPMLALSALTFITGKGYFRPRYVASTSPFLLILLALITVRVAVRHRALAYVSLTPIIALSLGALIQYHFNTANTKAPPWPSIVNIIESNTSQSDLVILNYPDPAFTYYYRNSLAPFITLPTAANPPITDTVTQLDNALDGRDYIWFIPVQSNAWDKDHVVASWLANNLQPILQHNVGVIQLITYGRWDPSPSAIQYHTNIEFNHIATLNGYRLTPPNAALHPGDMLVLEIFWTPLAVTTTPLTIFTHLITTKDTPPTLLTQDDHPPQNGRLTTTNWPLNKLTRDIYHLLIPLNANLGQYTLTIGFYDPVTTKRSPLNPNTPQAEPDGAELLTINITP